MVFLSDGRVMGMMGAGYAFDGMVSRTAVRRARSERATSFYPAAYFVLYPFISLPRTALGVPLPTEVAREGDTSSGICGRPRGPMGTDRVWLASREPLFLTVYYIGVHM